MMAATMAMTGSRIYLSGAVLGLILVYWQLLQLSGVREIR
jgi:hypothetical protein